MQVFTQKTRMLFTMIAVAATTGIASTAHAGGTAAGVTQYDNVVVAYADLNLNSAAGNKALYARLSSAASRACGSAPQTRAPQHYAQYRACVERTLDRAVAKVGSSDLQSLHESRSIRRAG